jgi:sec-independent protein translocase protein TatA
VLILCIVLLLFGGKKIPELMKGLGQGIKEFKDASKGDENKPTVSKENQIEEK